MTASAFPVDSIAQGAHPFYNFIKKRRERQGKVITNFPAFNDELICDPGYVHEKFHGSIHPGNQEAVKRIVNKWLAALPILKKPARALGLEKFRNVKVIERDKCKLRSEHLAKNLLAIGSAKSTLTSQLALGYKIEPRLELSDRFKGICKWEFGIDYNEPVVIKQKIEDETGDTATPHETKFRYLFNDSRNPDESKKPRVEKSLIKREYAVLTKIPNRIKYEGNEPSRIIYIFQGLHSVGTKAIEQLIWEKIERIIDLFDLREINPEDDSYQILFQFPILRYDDRPTKAWEPDIAHARVADCFKISSKKVKQLPDIQSQGAIP